MNCSFVFDANRCTGCGACQVACTIENGLAPDVSWRRVETFNPRRHPLAPLFHLSLACNHCADAACMRACPALAYAREPVTLAVLIDADKCIGCGYCAWACPYDAPVFDEKTGVMSKCTWCADRLRAGLKPACASHCPTGALDYADVPRAARVLHIDGLPQTRLGPSLHVVPLKPGRLQPEMTAGEVVDPIVGTPPPARTPTAISLRTEWPLAAFTLVAATLVALVAGAAAGTFALDWRLFAAASAAGMALASAHLGRRTRAWRAVLNLRRSWLSREVAALSVFFGLATWWLALAPESRALGWAVTAVGFVGLVAADQLYSVLPGGAGYRHSAGVTWIGLVLAALAARVNGLAALVLLLQSGLYAHRKQIERRPGQGWVSAVRAGAGLVAPLVLLFMGPPAEGAVVALVVAGAVVDRCEFYTELERESPRRQMDLALARRVAPGAAAGPRFASGAPFPTSP